MTGDQPKAKHGRFFRFFWIFARITILGSLIVVPFAAYQIYIGGVTTLAEAGFLAGVKLYLFLVVLTATVSGFVRSLYNR